MNKNFTLMILIAIPAGILLCFLFWCFGDSWMAIVIFGLVLAMPRIGLYFYRRAKGTKDDFSGSL